jgi:hypothetical protein
MKLLLIRTLGLLLVATAAMAAGHANASQTPANDTCSLYGYARGTHDYAVCRMNVRHYWSTGPCSDSRFALVHRRYCHLIPTIDF